MYYKVNKKNNNDTRKEERGEEIKIVLNISLFEKHYEQGKVEKLSELIHQAHSAVEGHSRKVHT